MISQRKFKTVQRKIIIGQICRIILSIIFLMMSIKILNNFSVNKEFSASLFIISSLIMFLEAVLPFFLMKNMNHNKIIENFRSGW